MFRADRDEKDSRVAYWLGAIRCHAPNAPIIIVATHLDKYVDPKGNKKIRPHMVEEALNPAIMEKYRPKSPRLERTIRAVSTLTFKGMDELIRHIHDVAVKQPYAQEPPPEKWFELEQKFLEHRRGLSADNMVPILTWEEASAISRLSQFPSNDNGAELVRAVDYLHETGSVLRHTYTDPLTGLSKRTVILDPQWAARVFSTVITTKHGFLRTGVLEEQKLFDQLWREFPKTAHKLLLELFEQADLFYRIMDDKGNPTGEVMVPATLPANKPADVQSLLPGKETSLYQFERRYAFEFIPAGLFSRYLVRVMNLGTALRYWRHGCLLQDKDSSTYALIELKPQSNLLSIIVRSGRESSQLFCKLAELFEFLIHHSFKETIYQPQYLDPIANTVFTLEQIEEASAKGNTTIADKDGHDVSIDRVAPDLALTTFAALQADIDNEVKLLPTPLGEGAFAIVYEGVYKNEKVAVKRLLRCSTEEQQKRIFSEFRREVLTMSQVSHPNIVNLRAFSSQPPFSMIMELVPHGTLYEFLRRPGDLPWPMRIRIAYDIASAMNFLHSADPPLIHKDLKSPNILMAGTKFDDLVVAKVADFGISGKLYSSKFKAISAKEREVENPTWLAPEIVKTQPYTAAADVYPYGVILWEIAARAHPFDEFKCFFPTDLEAVIVSGKRPTIPPGTPQAFEALILDCWHENPSRRPTFAQILARFPSIISEVAPTLPTLLSRIRRDLVDFNKQQEILKRARDIERREKWVKMRAEESARAAEKKRLQAISLASSSTAASEDDFSTDTEESTEASSEGAGSARSHNGTFSGDDGSSTARGSPNSLGQSLSRQRSRDDISASNGSLRRNGTSTSLRGGMGLDIGGVYHKLSEAELKDLWIQRGIPLPSEANSSRERLVEVLETDDQWLFNQRRVLFTTSSSSLSAAGSSSKPSTPGTARATYAEHRQSLSTESVPHAISLPCLYTISPQLLTTEIQERNDLLAQQEKALGELLKRQEGARLELHLKHQRAIEARLQKELASPASSAPPTPVIPHNKETLPVPGLNRTPSVASPKDGSRTGSVSSLRSAFGGAAPPTTASPPPMKSPTVTPRDPSLSVSSSPPTSALPAKPSSSTTLNRTGPAPPRPDSSPSVPPKNAASPSVPTLKRELSVNTTSAESSTPPTSAKSPRITTIGPSSTPANSATASSADTLSVQGSWSVEGRTAGGSPNTAQWRRNPQYSLSVGPGGGTVKITLAQKLKDPLPFIAFYIFKATDSMRVLDMKDKIYATEHFVNKESIEAVCNFPEGLFSIMCATFQPDTSSFTLTVSGPCVQTIQPVSEYSMAEVSSAWLKPLAGGCMNHPTWRSNPKFSLTVPESESKTKVYGVLIAQSEVGSGFYVFGPNQNVPIGKSGFTTVSVGHEFSVGPGSFTILPATYEFGKESPFELTLYTDKPVELATL